MNLIYKISCMLALAAVLVTAASCSKDDDAGGNGIILGGTTLSNDYTKRIEVPALKNGNIFIQHSTKVGADSVMTYCLEYNPAQWHSRWVAFRFDATTRMKRVSRKDYSIKPQYPADPKLNPAKAIEDDASFNRYNHGHLCASADRLFSREGNDQTFYMTNMSPQNGNFNSSYWSVLEGLVQEKGRDNSLADTLYVCKGGTIESGQILTRVADKRIVVPKYYFMALLKVKNGAYSSIAFCMEHKDYGRGPHARSVMAKHAMSVDQLEEFTGIDFFHNLPDKAEIGTETSYSLNVWGL